MLYISLRREKMCTYSELGFIRNYAICRIMVEIFLQFINRRRISMFIPDGVIFWLDIRGEMRSIDWLER